MMLFTESDTTAEYESAGEASPWEKPSNLSAIAEYLEGVHLSTPDKKVYSKLTSFPFSPIPAEEGSDDEVTAIISSRSQHSSHTLSFHEEEDLSHHKEDDTIPAKANTSFSDVDEFEFENSKPCKRHSEVNIGSELNEALDSLNTEAPSSEDIFLYNKDVCANAGEQFNLFTSLNKSVGSNHSVEETSSKTILRSEDARSSSDSKSINKQIASTTEVITNQTLGCGNLEKEFQQSESEKEDVITSDIGSALQVLDKSHDDDYFCIAKHRIDTIFSSKKEGVSNVISETKQKIDNIFKSVSPCKEAISTSPDIEVIEESVKESQYDSCSQVGMVYQEKQLSPILAVKKKIDSIFSAVSPKNITVSSIMYKEPCEKHLLDSETKLPIDDNISCITKDSEKIILVEKQDQIQSEYHSVASSIVDVKSKVNNSAKQQIDKIFKSSPLKNPESNESLRTSDSIVSTNSIHKDEYKNIVGICSPEKKFEQPVTELLNKSTILLSPSLNNSLEPTLNSVEEGLEKPELSYSLDGDISVVEKVTSIESLAEVPEPANEEITQNSLQTSSPLEQSAVYTTTGEVVHLQESENGSSESDNTSNQDYISSIFGENNENKEVQNYTSPLLEPISKETHDNTLVSNSNCSLLNEVQVKYNCDQNDFAQNTVSLKSISISENINMSSNSTPKLIEEVDPSAFDVSNGKINSKIEGYLKENNVDMNKQVHIVSENFVNNSKVEVSLPMPGTCIENGISCSPVNEVQVRDICDQHDLSQNSVSLRSIISTENVNVGPNSGDESIQEGAYEVQESEVVENKQENLDPKFIVGISKDEASFPMPGTSLENVNDGIICSLVNEVQVRDIFDQHDLSQNSVSLKSIINTENVSMSPNSGIDSIQEDAFKVQKSEVVENKQEHVDTEIFVVISKDEASLPTTRGNIENAYDKINFSQVNEVQVTDNCDQHDLSQSSIITTEKFSTSFNSGIGSIQEDGHKVQEEAVENKLAHLDPKLFVEISKDEVHFPTTEDSSEDANEMANLHSTGQMKSPSTEKELNAPDLFNDIFYEGKHHMARMMGESSLFSNENIFFRRSSIGQIETKTVIDSDHETADLNSSNTVCNKHTGPSDFPKESPEGHTAVSQETEGFKDLENHIANLTNEEPKFIATHKKSSVGKSSTPSSPDKYELAIDSPTELLKLNMSTDSNASLPVPVIASNKTCSAEIMSKSNNSNTSEFCETVQAVASKQKISPLPSSLPSLHVQGEMTTKNENVTFNLNTTKDIRDHSPVNRNSEELKYSSFTDSFKTFKLDDDLNDFTVERKSYEDLLDRCLEQERQLGFESIKEEADKLIKELANASSSDSDISLQLCDFPLENVNNTEAGPVTADEDFNKGDIFQDATLFDFDCLSKIGKGKPDHSRLCRESLFLKFDPLASAAAVTPEPLPKMAQPDSSSDAIATPPRAPLPNGDDKLVSISPNEESVCSPANLTAATPPPSSLTVATPPRAKLRPPSGSATPTLRHEILSKEISKLQDLMLRQESSYQEQIAACSEELEQLREKVAELEARDNQDNLQGKLEATEAEARQLRKELAETQEGKKQLMRIMEEYEKTISQVVTMREDDKKKFEIEKEQIGIERDEAVQHLRNMEIAFNDVHHKYEKCKEAIEAFKHNEEQYKISLNQNKKTILLQEENFQKLKEHAAQKLEQANIEIAEMKKSQQSELAKMVAVQRKMEIKVKSLEESLEQKKREVAELTKICDDLITKVEP